MTSSCSLTPGCQSGFEALASVSGSIVALNGMPAAPHWALRRWTWLLALGPSMSSKETATQLKKLGEPTKQVKVSAICFAESLSHDDHVGHGTPTWSLPASVLAEPGTWVLYAPCRSWYYWAGILA